MITPGGKSGIKKDSVKLISYAQRRTQYKKESDLTLSESVGDLNNYKPSYTTNRPTLGMSSDLRKLREIKKAEKQAIMDDDDIREEMLFGDIETIQSNTHIPQKSSRNKLAERRTIDYSGQYQMEEDEDIVYQDSSEENFKLYNIEEHDEIITTIPAITMLSNKHQMENVKPTSYKEVLMSPDTGLEVIKEMEDANFSPIKTHSKYFQNMNSSKLLFGKEKDIKEIKEEKHLEEEKVPIDNTQGYVASKMRRGTVAIKQPTRLELGLVDDKKVPKAFNRLRQENERHTGTKYTNLGNNSFKSTSSRLKKPDSKFKRPVENQIKSPSNRITGLKNLNRTATTLNLGTSIKRPATTRALNKLGVTRQLPQTPKAVLFNKSIKKGMSQEQKNELEVKKKFDEEIRERKRKMMDERKILLKKKISAIKIQKFWRARARRRKVKLDFIKYKASIRIIQKWYKAIFESTKAKNAILQK
jgi:hypothetical protein